MISFTNSSKEYKRKCSFVLWKSICYILRGNLGFTNCMKNWKRRNMEKTKRRKTISHICIPPCLSHTAKVLFLKSCTVWPQPIWIKVRTWWQIPPQHQSTYLGGPESASIETPSFRPHFIFQKYFFFRLKKIFKAKKNFGAIRKNFIFIF